jgi:hypothetical protein
MGLRPTTAARKQQTKGCATPGPGPRRRAAEQQAVEDDHRRGSPRALVLGHLHWATWHFQDIAQVRTGGANVFGNVGVRYTGSADDAALNAGVLRDLDTMLKWQLEKTRVAMNVKPKDGDAPPEKKPRHEDEIMAMEAPKP